VKRIGAILQLPGFCGFFMFTHARIVIDHTGTHCPSNCKDQQS